MSDQQTTLDRLRGDAETMSWFRRRAQPIPNTSLACYQFRPNTSVLSLPPIDNNRAALILAGLNNITATLAQWEKKGYVNVDLFSWMYDGVTVDGTFEPGIGDLIDKEFKVYNHHQALRTVRQTSYIPSPVPELVTAFVQLEVTIGSCRPVIYVFLSLQLSPLPIPARIRALHCFGDV